MLSSYWLFTVILMKCARCLVEFSTDNIGGDSCPHGSPTLEGIEEDVK